MKKSSLSTQEKRKRLRNKADRLLQEVIREIHDHCMVCGGELSCGHHYYPKSTSSNLRYDLNNIVPICQGCHIQHHSGNPEIHNRVNEIWGEERLEDLKTKKRVIFTKTSLEYYQSIIDMLTKIKEGK